MKRFWFVTVFLAISFVCLFYSEKAAFSHHGDSYQLKYKMQKGNNFTYALTSKTETTQEVMGSEYTTENKTHAKINIASEGTNKSGDIIFTMAYDSLIIDINSVMLDTALNNPPEIVGKRVKKIINPFGDQISSVELDSIKTNRYLSQVSSHYEFFPNLPTGSIKMGEVVTISDVDTNYTMNGSTVAKSNTEFTLVGKEAKYGFNCLKIDFKSTFNLEGDGYFQGFKFFIEGDGANEGTLYFAPEEGVLVTVENVTDIEMTAAITGQQNMTIPITQTRERKLLLVK
jgi:hypothetical protein